MAKRKSKEIYLMPEPKWKEINTVPEDKLDQMWRGFEYFVHYEVNDKKQVTIKDEQPHLQAPSFL